MQNKLLLSATFLFFILLTLFSLHIPFFWDGTFFSEAAVHLFENGFHNFIPNKETDTGGFPLYSIYLAIVWKLFAKSLLVSHLAVLPFLLGIAYEYFKLAKRFLNPTALLFAMFLLLTEPTLITQSILIGYDVLMIYFFLLSLNALLRNTLQTKAPLASLLEPVERGEGQGVRYSIALTFLCISSVRGSMLGISLLILDFALNSFSFKKIKFINYLFPLLIIVIWTIYHFIKTGWFFISPERENTHEAMASLPMMVRQLFFITWKISDFGRVVLWLFLIVSGIYFYKKQTTSELKILFKIIFIPLLTLSLFMIPLSNPMGHKYFIVVYLCLHIGVCFLIQQLNNKKIRIVFITIFCISLLTGNFWLYPERFGNGWDSSLKVLPYFELKNQMDEFIKTEKIDSKQIGTQFPLIAEKKYSHLSDTSFYYSNIWNGPISTYPYFLFTNVINSDISNQMDEAKNTWQLVKSMKSGEVYISLYKQK